MTRSELPEPQEKPGWKPQRPTGSGGGRTAGEKHGPGAGKTRLPAARTLSASVSESVKREPAPMTALGRVSEWSM